MSRRTIIEKGIEKEILDDPEKCRFLIDEVCCNAEERNMVADFPAKEYCMKCKFFEKEKLPER